MGEAMNDNKIRTCIKLLCRHIAADIDFDAWKLSTYPTDDWGGGLAH